jgi:hypothetical protein
MLLRNLVIAGLGAACLFAGPAKAMTFERVHSRGCHAEACIVARGEIEKDTADQFKAFVRARGIPAGSVVVFDSPGGLLLQSLKLGEAIRAAGLYTAVGRYDRIHRQFTRGGECVSACAYAFLGGVQRDVAEHARLGVHQFSCEPGREGSLDIADAQQLMALIQIYAEKMVGKAAVVTLAAGTSPADTRWLSAGELRRYQVVTGPLGPQRHDEAGVEVELDRVHERGLNGVAIGPAEAGDLPARAHGLGGEGHLHVIRIGG